MNEKLRSLYLRLLRLDVFDILFHMTEQNRSDVRFKLEHLAVNNGHLS